MNSTKLQDLLENLGLTEYESKTLTSLFNLKEAKAPDISTHAQVPKTRVYDVLTKLVEKDLIIEIQGRPKKYRAVEAEKVFQKLVDNKKNDLSVLEKDSFDAVNFLGTGVLDDEEEKVMKVKDKQDFIKVLAQELKEAKESIFAFTDTSIVHPGLKKILQDAKNNDLDVKVLAGTNHTFEKELKNLNLPKKQADHGMEAFIIDNNKLILALSDMAKDKSEYHFTIWKNTPLIRALNTHFNQLWEA